VLPARAYAYKGWKHRTTIMSFLLKSIIDYAEAHTTPTSPLLKKLERETWVKRLHAGMVSGGYQGQFLRMLSQMIRPKRVLEIGTFTGYSAICLAEGLTEDGLLHTIEINEELETPIQEYFDAAGLTNKIQLHIGNALELVPTIDEQFDLVFIDADKINYSRYYDLVFDKVKTGGYMLADNVLWYGKVTENQHDEETAALHAFNQKVQNDPRVENVLITLRDGLTLIRKT